MAIVRPHGKFQEEYLNSNAKILVVGGSAGSSKTYVGIMRHLRWIHHRRYSGYIIRKNNTTIMKGGGILEQAYEMYRQVEPKCQLKRKDQKIVFPSGAQVCFSNYENNDSKEIYRGLELSNVMYDEATDADESHIWWLFSRLRKPGEMEGLEPSIWLTCNPNPDSYLRKWVDWWLLPEGHPHAGRRDPEKQGITRYCLRRGNDLVFRDTAQELIDEYGHDYPTIEDCRPIAFQVMLGTIDDNPELMRTQPEYRANLLALPDVEKEQLFWGNWDVRPEASGFFKRHWVTEHIEEPDDADIVKTVRSYDLASELKSDLNPNPDYSTSVKMSLLKNGDYFIHHVERFRKRYGDLLSHILKNAEFDGKHVTVDVPQDPNAAAKFASRQMVSAICKAGYHAVSSKTSQSKLDRFRPFSGLAQNGNVHVLKDCGFDWENRITHTLSFYYDELEKFDGKRSNRQDKHDDMADATSSAFLALATIRRFPKAMSGSIKSLGIRSPNPFTKME